MRFDALVMAQAMDSAVTRGLRSHRSWKRIPVPGSVPGTAPLPYREGARLHSCFPLLPRIATHDFVLFPLHCHFATHGIMYVFSFLLWQLSIWSSVHFPKGAVNTRVMVVFTQKQAFFQREKTQNKAWAEDQMQNGRKHEQHQCNQPGVRVGYVSDDGSDQKSAHNVPHGEVYHWYSQSVESFARRTCRIAMLTKCILPHRSPFFFWMALWLFLIILETLRTPRVQVNAVGGYIWTLKGRSMGNSLSSRLADQAQWLSNPRCCRPYHIWHHIAIWWETGNPFTSDSLYCSVRDRDSVTAPDGWKVQMVTLPEVSLYVEGWLAYEFTTERGWNVTEYNSKKKKRDPELLSTRVRQK